MEVPQTLLKRNPLPLPPIKEEEGFSKPLELKPWTHDWKERVCHHCRLNMHHTLASIRWDHRLKGPFVPKHSLDLALSAVYEHGPELWSEKCDVCRQAETIGRPSWRLLTNVRLEPIGTIRRPTEKELFQMQRAGRRARRDIGHPIRYGGIEENLSPFSVKLGMGSFHSPQSTNGYTRNSYGAFYTS